MHLSFRSSRLAWLSVGLLALGLLAAACMPGTPVPPLSTVTAPTATSAPPATSASGIQAGVDADGNFYRGNPNAAVKLVEFSDFQ